MLQILELLRNPTQPPVSEEANRNHKTMLEVLEHLGDLSQLVFTMRQASASDMGVLRSRLDKVVTDLHAMELRVHRSLASFDALQLRLQEGLADRPPLTDQDLDRVADAVTERLLDHVRVASEEPRRK